MKIKTKFEIGQEVYVIIPFVNDWGGTSKIVEIVKKFTIMSIETKTDKDATHIMYWLDGRGKEDEERIYSTKEEAEAELKRMCEWAETECYLQQAK